MIVAPTMEENSGIFESGKLNTGRLNGHSITINTGNREPKELDSPSSSSSSDFRLDSDASSVTGSSSNLDRRLSSDGKTEKTVSKMSSTNSAGTEYGRGRGHGHTDNSCGLVGSLFSGGCRGRAEAFARRLHRRLTSLGNADDSSRGISSTTTSTSSSAEAAVAAAAAAAVITKPITREVASWLHAPSETAAGNPIDRIFRHQSRNSPETELYCDFEDDLDFEHEPSSPAEEVTPAELADLLVNTEILKTNHHETCHCSSNGPRLGIDQESESECVFASPASGTSPASEASEIYFDPESSDAEKIKNEVYFDPVTSSESESTSNVCNNLDDVSVKEKPSLSVDGSSIYREDSSDSSLSVSKYKPLPLERFRLDTRQNRPTKEECSSEDSLNDRSSRETTSPSHESLWSTFDDDSTVSLRDETTRPGNNYLPTCKHLPKSHSDSEILDNIGTITLAPSTLPRTIEKNEEEGYDIIDFFSFPEELTQDPIKEQDSSSCDFTEDKLIGNVTTEEAETISDDSPTDANGQIDTDLEESAINDGDLSVYVSTLNIADQLVVECPTGRRLTEKLNKPVMNEVTLQIENETVLNAKSDEKISLFLLDLDKEKSNRDRSGSINRNKWGDERVASKEAKEENEDVEDDEEEGEERESMEEGRPRRLRRCSSLKTGKTPPGTPGRKKIVRFADVLGLDLADVRTFLDEIPKIPNSAYSDLIYDDSFQKESSPANLGLSTSWHQRYSPASTSRVVDRTLVPLFQQPGGLPNFLDFVRERKVCLENVLVQDPLTLCIQGTVRVLNLDFHKSVHIRYTLNSWKNFSDLQASYISNSCDGFSDKFSFILYCHTLTIGQRLEFAVRFQCKGTQFWDNNAGTNYCFQCLPVSSSVEYISVTARENQRDWSPVFY
ncbi:glycogen-binding subunit 76A-like isoform X1 [Vespa mandarinia]|uniref:glycogen-binding subunit 76A-like isoform X1 n=1 Tax=Vespa mandarinia TaxID=7446 RepID=UPI0016073DD0|nr:glycogen-binding subunit 76A-like isoform X1 [Vespa mandarinia]